MKKIIVATILLSFSFSKAQIVFCRPGSQWNYLFTGYFNNTPVHVPIKYSGFAIENGDTISKLIHTRFLAEQNSEIFLTYTTSIKQKGDTVFMRNNITNNQWQILYNFASQGGDTWINNFSNGYTYTTAVISTGTATIENLNLRLLNVKYFCKRGPFNVNYTGTIYERFGSDRYLFNYVSREYQSGDMALDFLCYKDDDVGTRQLSTTSCEYVYTLGVNNNQIGLESVKIYPNPVKDILSLAEGNSNYFEKVSVLNNIGQEVYEQVKPMEYIKINVSHLPSGIYFLKADGSYGQKLFKFIKE